MPKTKLPSRERTKSLRSTFTEQNHGKKQGMPLDSFEVVPYQSHLKTLLKTVNTLRKKFTSSNAEFLNIDEDLNNLSESLQHEAHCSNTYYGNPNLETIVPLIREQKEIIEKLLHTNLHTNKTTLLKVAQNISDLLDNISTKFLEKISTLWKESMDLHSTMFYSHKDLAFLEKCILSTTITLSLYSNNTEDSCDSAEVITDNTSVGNNDTLTDSGDLRAESEKPPEITNPQRALEILASLAAEESKLEVQGTQPSTTKLTFFGSIKSSPPLPWDEIAKLIASICPSYLIQSPISSEQLKSLSMQLSYRFNISASLFLASDSREHGVTQAFNQLFQELTTCYCGYPPITSIFGSQEALPIIKTLKAHLIFCITASLQPTVEIPQTIHMLQCHLPPHVVQLIFSYFHYWCSQKILDTYYEDKDLLSRFEILTSELIKICPSSAGYILTNLSIKAKSTPQHWKR